MHTMSNEIIPGIYQCERKRGTPAFKLTYNGIEDLDNLGRGSVTYSELTATICPNCSSRCPKGALLQLIRARYPLPDDDGCE